MPDLAFTSLIEARAYTLGEARGLRKALALLRTESGFVSRLSSSPMETMLSNTAYTTVLANIAGRAKGLEVAAGRMRCHCESEGGHQLCRCPSGPTVDGGTAQPAVPEEGEDSGNDTPVTLVDAPSTIRDLATPSTGSSSSSSSSSSSASSSSSSSPDSGSDSDSDSHSQPSSPIKPPTEASLPGDGSFTSTRPERAGSAFTQGAGGIMSIPDPGVDSSPSTHAAVDASGHGRQSSSDTDRPLHFADSNGRLMTTTFGELGINDGTAAQSGAQVAAYSAMSSTRPEDFPTTHPFGNGIAASPVPFSSPLPSTTFGHQPFSLAHAAEVRAHSPNAAPQFPYPRPAAPAEPSAITEQAWTTSPEVFNSIPLAKAMSARSEPPYSPPPNVASFDPLYNDEASPISPQRFSLSLANPSLGFPSPSQIMYSPMGSPSPPNAHGSSTWQPSTQPWELNSPTAHSRNNPHPGQYTVPSPRASATYSPPAASRAPIDAPLAMNSPLRSYVSPYTTALQRALPPSPSSSAGTVSDEPIEDVLERLTSEEREYIASLFSDGEEAGSHPGLASAPCGMSGECRQRASAPTDEAVGGIVSLEEEAANRCDDKEGTETKDEKAGEKAKKKKKRNDKGKAKDKDASKENDTGQAKEAQWHDEKEEDERVKSNTNNGLVPDNTGQSYLSGLIGGVKDTVLSLASTSPVAPLTPTAAAPPRALTPLPNDTSSPPAMPAVPPYESQPPPSPVAPVQRPYSVHGSPSVHISPPPTLSPAAPTFNPVGVPDNQVLPGCTCPGHQSPPPSRASYNGSHSAAWHPAVVRTNTWCELLQQCSCTL